MKPLKVLHVIAGMDPKMGGVCKAVRIIIAGFSEFDIYNEVVSLDSPDATYLIEDTFKTHAIGPGKSSWCYNSKLLDWAKMNLCGFDIVIVHGLWLYPSYAIRKAVSLLRKEGKKPPKFFVMPHGMLDPYFQRAAGRKLKAIRNWVYWKFIESKVISNANGLLFTCEEEKKLAGKTFTPYFPRAEIVVGLGVEAPPLYIDEMRSAFLEICPEMLKQPYLLFISRIHEKKGVDLLINAYAEIYQQQLEGSSRINGQERDLLQQIPKLVIAGPGIKTLYGKKIQQLVSEKPFLKDQVCFSGMLEGKAKWGAFYGCEAFILPSHQENFGIAVAEALACGKPVLISDQVNIWREIKAMDAGVVANDTKEGTVQLLQSWIRLTTPQRLEMGLSARNCFMNNFSINLTTQKLIKAIKC